MARLAKVNVATLNYHFGGKEALHTAVLDAAHETLTGFTAPDGLPDEPEQRIRIVIAALYHFARSRRSALRLLLRTTLQEGALPEPLRERQATDGMAFTTEAFSGNTSTSNGSPPVDTPAGHPPPPGR